jgi:hypothetical protein
VIPEVIFFLVAGVISALVFKERVSKRYNIAFVSTYFVIVSLVFIVADPLMILTGITFGMFLAFMGAAGFIAYWLLIVAQLTTLHLIKSE